MKVMQLFALTLTIGLIIPKLASGKERSHGLQTDLSRVVPQRGVPAPTSNNGAFVRDWSAGHLTGNPGILVYHDQKSNLYWTRVFAGMSNGGLSFAKAKEFCEKLAPCETEPKERKWSLPNPKQIQKLVDHKELKDYIYNGIGLNKIWSLPADFLRSDLQGTYDLNRKEIVESKGETPYGSFQCVCD